MILEDKVRVHMKGYRVFDSEGQGDAAIAPKFKDGNAVVQDLRVG